MNSKKYNFLKVFPIVSALLILDGWMPRQADGSYPRSVYSYHSYNKPYPLQSSSPNGQNTNATYLIQQKAPQPYYSSRSANFSKPQMNYTRSPFVQPPQNNQKPLYIDSYTNKPVYQNNVK